MKTVVFLFTAFFASLLTISAFHSNHASAQQVFQTVVGDPQEAYPAEGEGDPETAEPGGDGKYTFYCQYDPVWSKNGCNIIKYGCGPSSIAMIMKTFGDKMNPLKVALENNRSGCGGPSNFNDDFKPWVLRQGYMVGSSVASGSYFNIKLAKQYLKQGYFIMSGANIKYNYGNTSSGGHSFVVFDINDKNIATVYDPTYCSSNTNFKARKFTISPVGFPLVSDGNGNRWYWAYPLKKRGS